MSRRHVAAKREILPDPKYGDRTLAKFINMVMSRGKKATAEKIVYGALEDVEQRGRGTALEIFKQALENVEPKVEVKSRRVGGATYQVPMPVKRRRATTLAIRWILEATKKRKGRPMFKRLADELIMAYRREGAAILLISEDLDEVMALSDRIQVIFRGRLSEPVAAADADSKRIGLLMAGIWEGEHAA